MARIIRIGYGKFVKGTVLGERKRRNDEYDRGRCEVMNGFELCLVEIFKCVMDKKHIILAGAGARARDVIHYLESENIAVECLCDNAKNKQGAVFEGKDVLSFQAAVRKYKNGFFVITVEKGAANIRKQLLELGISLQQCYICLWGRDYDYYRQCSDLQLPEEIKLRYARSRGKYLDFKEVNTFNEKIQWMMAYDSNEYKSRLADKILVRSWIKEKIGEDYLIPICGVWRDVESIPFEQLPDKYVLKANHGCGWNVIVTDKASVDVNSVKRKLREWLEKNYAYAGLEMHYANIEPGILCEEYITNADGDVYDYKVWCFNGKPCYIQFLSERKKGLKMAFYDTDWNRMPFYYDHEPLQGEAEKPKNLRKMLELSEKLSQEFAFVRVDWYVLNDGSLKFGEMTFTPAAGRCEWIPEGWDEKLGELIHI